MPNLKDKIGFTDEGPAIASPAEENRLREFVNLKLAARGYSIVGDEADYPFLDLGRSLIASFQEKTRLLSDYLCPADAYIDGFLRDYLGSEIIAEVFPETPHLLPVGALVMDPSNANTLYLGLGDAFDGTDIAVLELDDLRAAGPFKRLSAQPGQIATVLAHSPGSRPSRCS